MINQLDTYLNDQLNKTKDANLYRELKSTKGDLISFASNDYLGLRKDKRLIEVAKKDIEYNGIGSGSSRLVSGNLEAYSKLETLLSDIYGYESSLVYGSGYLANIGLISSIMGRGDIIIADKLSHACIIDGAKLSGAELKRFNHNNLESLEMLLAKHRERYNKCLVVSEAVFSMDGDRSDILSLKKLSNKYNATLMIDFAHDLEHFNNLDIDKFKPDILMGTFSKALGSYGGYICGNKNLIEFLINKSRSLIFTTALPSSILVASYKALVISKAEPNLVEKALKNSLYFKQLMQKNLPQLKIGASNSQIVPLILGDEKMALKLSEYLLLKGFQVPAIRPPTVPKDTARLRFSFCADHKQEEITNLVDNIIEFFNER